MHRTLIKTCLQQASAGRRRPRRPEFRNFLSPTRDSWFSSQPLHLKWRGRRRPEVPWLAVAILVINPFLSVSCGKYLENVIYDQIGRYVVYFKTPLKDLKNKLFMHKLQDAFKMI